MSDVLVCSNERTYHLVSTELFNTLDVKCEHLDSTDCLTKMRKMSREIRQAKKLIVDLDDITTSTVVAMSFAYSYNVEIIGVFNTDIDAKKTELIKDNKGQILDLCDDFVEIDDIGEVFV